ncbi:Short-chain dehydrogenase/reductase SDR [Kalmanozyma brasiliensis GHG001]|uniref:Short-chain dehydrogenase n=1 Tax=Kalmanozyma brasiliensis (strain GHG001) TaxID=1365824 RepID=V5EWL8_KALBG|nr:Short-chain dehydrogenase/reductase SDR [Kalmanozyma brasiliensis GHG001]EST07763.1 Short-chain dehydrogenase/reductase SDR [Kalmanozyma brasiliensis GHG001]
MVTALVSGGNRGLGYGIVRRLANEYPSSPLSKSTSDKLTIYLGSRDVSKGEDAKKSLQSELASDILDKVSIEVRQLDTTSHDSIVKLGSELQSGVDILINNAGIAMDGFDGNVAKQTVRTNYYAVQDMIQNIKVKDGGRIVNIASLTGVLKNFGDNVRDRFRESKSIKDVDDLMQEFQDVVADGSWKEKGWKGAAYATSKSGVIAYTRALAKEYEQQGKNVFVVSCCPGYVNTDMTKGKGYKTLDQGAETPVLLALQEVGAKPGEFWSEKKANDWENP